MSTVLRCWEAANKEAPTSAGISATAIGQALEEIDAKELAVFMKCAYAAWRNDAANFRLWGALNLGLCMWIWRNVVTGAYSVKSVRLDAQQFTRCLMTLSATTDYVDWLLGRHLSERERPPAYARIKQAFNRRLAEDMPGAKVYWPAPDWAHGASR
jgi:hypothetical protein